MATKKEGRFLPFFVWRGGGVVVVVENIYILKQNVPVCISSFKKFIYFMFGKFEI